MNEKVKGGPTVWVTQIPNRRDPHTRALFPSVNISPASEHGEIRVMMPANASFFATGELISQLRSALRSYDFERGDSVVCLGDPAIIAATGAVLAEHTKSFNVLRWDRRTSRYHKIKVQL